MNNLFKLNRSGRLTSNISVSRRKYSQTQKTEKKWQSVVGLEVHAQIATKSKLFSGASTEFASSINSNVSLFDAAVPGTLPVLNKKCVEAGVLTALALSCQVNAISTFDRKHYFYSDLTAGYQITQQRSPLANDGYLKFQVYTPGVHKSPYEKISRIKQLQLEQDSGKSLHDADAGKSWIDLNRAGIPLMELVFEPDLADGEEAAALVKELTIILNRLATCSCKMEEGALRVDANISVNKPGEQLGVRSEVKNIGSIRGVASAVNYEIDRQIKILEGGGTVVNETRAWMAQTKSTVSMRDKEFVQDYRFMPEPNLPPLHLNIGLQPYLSETFINVNDLKSSIPELPEETRGVLRKKYNLKAEQAIILVNEEMLLKYFKDISECGTRDPKIVANILINEILTAINKNKLNINDLPCHITSFDVGELIDLIQSKTINLVTARRVLDEIINGNILSPAEIIQKNNWAQITDKNEIKKICQEVLKDNSKLVKQYNDGKKKVYNALLGIIATKTQQRINMEEVNKILKLLLSKEKNV